MSRQSRPRARRTLAPQPAPPSLYTSSYDVEVGAAICRRLAAGESLRSICRLDPAMPTERTVWNWARAHKEFRWMKQHAQSVARAQSLAARDEALAAKRAAAGPPGGPRGRTGRPSGYDPVIADRVIARVMAQGLAAACREQDMPSAGTVYNWLKRYPEFLARYRWAKERAPDIMVSHACEPLEWLGSYHRSIAEVVRTVRAADKAAARVSLKRYAPPKGPSRLVVELEGAGGVSKVIYGG